MSWIVSLITSLLGLFLKRKQDQAEESGANRQKVTDLEAQLAQTQASAAVSSSVDQRIVQSAPGADTVVPTSELKDDPDLPQR